MTIQEKDYSLISKKLLSKADKDGIERKIVKVVVRKGDAILMLKRAETERFSGLYELPGGGGGLEENENVFF